MRGLTAFALIYALASTAAEAQVSCSATDQFVYNFGTATAATLNYASTYTLAATNGAAQSRNVTLSFATFNLASSLVASVQMPAVNTTINDANPTTARNLMIGGRFSARTANITANSSVIVTTFTFAVPVRDLIIQLNDIDFTTNQFRDWIHVTGLESEKIVNGTITTPFGTNNGAGAKTNASSSIQLGASTTPLTVGVDEGIGNATSPNQGTTGTMTVTFARPVTSITIRYGNSNQAAGGTTVGQQAYGIQSLRFCPMPNILIDKTSAPVATSGINAFNVPGADVDYAITVTNTGGSTVDLNSAVIGDILPSNVIFFNGDIDPGTAGTQNFVFTPSTSGLSIANGNIGYSNNGGTSFAYTPASGYDASVNALRFLPQGTMAANSSFTIRFRTRVK